MHETRNHSAVPEVLYISYNVNVVLYVLYALVVFGCIWMDLAARLAGI